MTIEVLSEPLTYRQDVRHSYFRDLALQGNDPAAADRLRRHAEEMAHVTQRRAQQAFQRMQDNDLEYRVNPDTTGGTGGYLTVPLWINQLFATAPRPGRVLAGLIKAAFDLPAGVSSVNVPILTKGTVVALAVDDAAVASQDITDAPGTSTVATLAGQADMPMQMLEQSPGGAHLDWVIFTDLAAGYDADLETQLLNGIGAAAKQILGVLNVLNTVGVTYTDAAPTGSAMYPFFGKAFARVGNNRGVRAECWLMRSARWGWLATSESTALLPFNLPGFYLGDNDATPDPVNGLVGLPVFTDDAIPAVQGAAANQDVVVALRPSDLILLEGVPQTVVQQEVLSGTLGVRFQMHNRAAAITNRYPSGISPITGTGLIVQSGFAN